MKRNKSVMEHSFSRVPKAEIPRSSFDRSHGLKTTFDAGLLIPILVDEALPGDTFNLEMTGFARLATPIFPIMDNMFMDTFFFFVPNRLLWENWEKFCGSQVDPGDSIDFLIPYIDSLPGGIPTSSLFDYMGIPANGFAAAYQFNALHYRAYNLIWNTWFRSEDLQDSETVPSNDGPDNEAIYRVLRRGKRHDYFTSCLPFAQKGIAVGLPLGTNAPVTTGAVDNLALSIYSTIQAKQTNMDTDGTAGGFVQMTSQTAPADSELYADLSAATSVTVNALRQAFQIQKLIERDARGGTRYTEVVKAHFGVTSPDARLQRPEYLGGGSSPIQITPVSQTSETGTTPQATLSAIGTASLHNHGFTKSFTEHGVIIGLISVRADLTYQQGLNRMWSRRTRYDFYWPALANIGEQAVLNQEIYAQGSTVPDNATFGYQERFAEYRYSPSRISGLFRSAAAVPLDAWHLSQDFASLPVLDDTFIQDNPPVDRVIAVPTEPHFLFDAYFNLRCARPMPLFGVPGLIDHF